MLLTPIDRGLETLEGQNTTCSDVFFVYVGIAIGFTRVFQIPGRSLYISLCIGMTLFMAEDEIFEYRDETYSVFDRRFSILMTESTPDLFLIAYLLDPSTFLHHFYLLTIYKCDDMAAVYYRDGALRLDLPPRISFSKSTASTLVLRLMKVALRMLEHEQARTSSGGLEQGQILAKQISGEL